MENSTVSGLRSRSRSKTPFLRSSCDRENCDEGEEHTHVTGRKTPVKRSSQTRQLQQSRRKSQSMQEENERGSVQHVHRTRQSMRTTEKVFKTSDYSSDENISQQKEDMLQSTHYESLSTYTQPHETFADLPLSPIQHVLTQKRRSSRPVSPAYSCNSTCSNASSFAQQALADTTVLLAQNPTVEHLPYRLYKSSPEYWNKYPKTDYTYSSLSKDRVELAPGQIAVPNMSRPSLAQARLMRSTTSVDEIDEKIHSPLSYNLRRRFAAVDSSDDESYYKNNGGYNQDKEWKLWWSNNNSGGYKYDRYPYIDRHRSEGIFQRAATGAGALLYWIYTTIKTVVTTTVTTITETVSPTRVIEKYHYYTNTQHSRQAEQRGWSKWLLLFLLLPIIGYGSYYTYENFDRHALPDFTDFNLNLSEFTAKLPTFALPNITVPEFSLPNIPEINLPNIAMPDISEKLPEVRKTYRVYKDIVHNRMADAGDYIKVVGQSCVEEIHRYWRGLIGYNYGVLPTPSSVPNQESVIVHSYKDMEIISQLIKRVEGLEKQQRDNKLYYDQLKSIFESQYATKDELNQFNLWFSKSEERVRQLVEEYVRVRVSEITVKHEGGSFDAEAVKKIVEKMLLIYDADKIGMVDYAMESAGGQVLSTKCTELYQIKTKQYSVLGMPIWWGYTSPRHALTAGAMPSECWAFQGFPGYLVIRTFAPIEVTGFTVEHLSKLLAPDGKIESAPKNFSVYGLHDETDLDPHHFGDYIYLADGPSIQYFPVLKPKMTTIADSEIPVAYDIIELRIESNHGNPTYTCLYRFRVHGNPLNKIS